MSENTAALGLQNISRRFGRTTALNDLSLDIGDGEIVCLVGHSGCGKSTLLRIIAGIEAPDEGTVRMHGEEVAGASGFVQPEHRRIGFVFQDYALFPHLTVDENIRFGLTRQQAMEASQRISELAAPLGIAPFAGRYPHMLSGGEQQRVALARALVRNPRIMLLDEPFSNLDRALRESVRRDTLSLLRQLGTTAIIVTHDPEEALSFGDRVVLMRSGEVVQAGSSYDLYDTPNSPYAAEFFAAYNKVPGTVRSGRIETAIGDFPLRASLPEGAAALAYIRPQDIELGNEADLRTGTILDRTLMGEIEQIVIGVEGLTVPLQVRSTKRLPLGNNRVTVGFSGAAVVGFARDN